MPPERAAQVIGMLLGVPVSVGFAGKAGARVNAQLRRAGFDEAMLAALAGRDVLGADETPVSVRGAKAAKRHHAVSGYRRSLDTAAARGTGVLDATRTAIEGNPWLPPLPAIGRE